MGSSDYINSDSKIKTKIFAIVDCNNFFVSCERVFRPDLKNKPVIVLSSNDGCAVARSNEAKVLGIPMGAPVFKYRNIIDKNKVITFSSNFTLYADISNRIMRILKDSAPELEVYSIDEAFLDLTSIQADKVTSYCQEIKNKIQTWTGIPVSIGIGSTKTLAKIGSEIAKKNPEYQGVVNLISTEQMDTLLEKIPVGDVWGIGRNYSRFLINKRISNAKNLKYIDLQWAKDNLKVLGQRTVLELNGISCYKLYDKHSVAKSIIVSRSFGKDVSNLRDLKESIAKHIAEGSRRLRQKNLKTQNINIYILTNRFRREFRHNSLYSTYELEEASSFTPELIKLALKELDQIYKPNYYKKSGISFTKLIPESSYQYNFFKGKKYSSTKIRNLMETVDKLNNIWGRGTLRIGAEGISQGWRAKAELHSPRYTTRWNELLELKV